MATIDVTEQTFETEVLERSLEMPVVVDFWADWCGPCHALSPILERLAAEADGEWVLAKIDVDSNPNLAAAAGVRGIPSVRAFRDGRQVAEFTGVLPEQQVRTWLAALGPSPAEAAFEEGVAAEGAGDDDAAVDAYRSALQHDPGHASAKQAVARLELKKRVVQTDREDVELRLAADSLDVDAAIAHADVLAAAGELTDAYDELIEVVRKTSNDERERARAHLVELLDIVPPDDPRAVAARRALSQALF